MELLHNFCCICLEEKTDFQRVTESDSNGIKCSQKLSICDPQQVSSVFLGSLNCIAVLQKLMHITE